MKTGIRFEAFLDFIVWLPSLLVPKSSVLVSPVGTMSFYVALISVHYSHFLGLPMLLIKKFKKMKSFLFGNAVSIL